MTASDEQHSIWRFIPLSEYERPSEPPTEEVRTRLLSLWQRLRWGTTTITPVQDEPDASSEISPDLEQDVDQIAPWPNWLREGAAALDDALEQWRTAPDAKAGCRIIVAPPFCRVEAMLKHWAHHHNYRLVEPPTYNDILQNSDDWLEKVICKAGTQRGSRFVLVALEHCYLRHYNGLELIRRLVRRLWQERLPCVLGCDSWAWAYLDFACHISMLDRAPLTLAPLDAEAISRWISQVEANVVKKERPLSLPYPWVYRRTDSGKRIHPVHKQAHDPDDFDPDDNDDLTSESLVHIAAQAGGIPGVVWALWRKSMSITNAGIIEDKARKVAQRDGKATVWVKKWETLDLPVIPRELGDTGAFALHAILLHSGLGFEAIEYLVPGSSLQLASDLHLLEAAQILEERDGRFYVTPVGYPTVRAFLNEESFVIDHL